MQIKAKIRGILEAQLNKQYAVRLARAKRRISYEEWLKLREDMTEDGAKAPAEVKEPGGMPEGTDVKLLEEQGIYLIRQESGKLACGALQRIVRYFDSHPGTQVLYGDEDVLEADGKHRFSPYFKPDWSPDTWLSCFYLGSVIAVRRELMKQILPETESHGGKEILFSDSTKIRLLVHRLLELAGGFTRGCGTIAHLPEILFHMDDNAAKAGIQKRYRQADGFGSVRQEVSELTQLFAESGMAGIWPEPNGKNPAMEKAGRENGAETPEVTVSVIIPSKDNPQVLEQCLNSLQRCQEGIERLRKAEGAFELEGGLRPARLEILVVDNGSSPENRAKIEKITCGMKYIYEPMPFNFSRMCNLGAGEATGELLLFLNDDITVNGCLWLMAMADRALRPYVGAVGLKLYYPDSKKIQHVGITNLPGGPVHKLQFTEDGQEDYGYGSLDRNVIGVTGACLMLQRDRFRKVGGFPEDLQVAYNDVELCFCLREAGWHNVVLNRYYAYHHESLSRGNDLTREKMLRLRQERETLYDRHPEYLNRDPYYPEPLCRELGDTGIREIYLDSRTVPQVISRFGRLGETQEQEPGNLCCMVRPEKLPPEPGTLPEELPPVCLRGYAVVKWENNACYDNYLLLKKQDGNANPHVCRLEGKYSREAEYGMQEQPNVALCGFMVALRRKALPDGIYRIGIQARSRLGRRRLTCWTGQTVQVCEGLFTAAERHKQCDVHDR